MYWTAAELAAGHQLPGDSRNESEKLSDEKEHARHILKEEIADAKRYYHSIIDGLTAKLCHACKILESNELIDGDGELSPWWEEHKLRDKMRLEDERR